MSECTHLIEFPVDDGLKLVQENRLCFNCMSNSYIIKECKSKVCFRIDSCSKRHHSLLHAPSGISSNDPHIYQNYHHATDSLGTEISKPLNESETTLQANWKKSYLFASHTDNVIKWTYFSINECTLGL